MGKSSQDILFLGRTNFRGAGQKFGIHKEDRRYHLYVIGQTGTGKSTFLGNLIRQDITNGQGLAIFDPHGDLAERLVRQVPQERRNDLIYFNATDTACPYGFNPLANVPPERRDLICSELIEAFKKIWEKYWGVRMEHIIRNSLMTLMEQPAQCRWERLFLPGFTRQRDQLRRSEGGRCCRIQSNRQLEKTRRDDGY